jgi:hypothetical protein
LCGHSVKAPPLAQHPEGGKCVLHLGTHVLSECEGGALGGVSLYNRISAFSILFIL